MAWYVYILQCADGTLYTGATTDPARRLQQHNAGTASRYTRSRRPLQLWWREIAEDKSAALKREAAIKRLSRRQKLALIATSPYCAFKNIANAQAASVRFVRHVV